MTSLGGLYSRRDLRNPCLHHLVRRCLDLVIAIDALAALVPFLRFEAQGCDRARIESFDTDGLAGLLAIAVGAIVDPAEGRIDFRYQLALPVARAKLDA